MASKAVQTHSDTADEICRQRVRAPETDSVTPETLEARRQRTLRALADVDAGRLHDNEAVARWVDRLDELPTPLHP